METLGGSSGRTKYVTGNVTLKAILGLCVCLCACVCLSLPPTHQSWNEQPPHHEVLLLYRLRYTEPYDCSLKALKP